MVLPAALVLWWLGAQGTRPEAMTDYGLLSALPVVYFLALGLLVVSVVATLARSELSPVRLGLHLVAFVVMVHGTPPLVFREPIYPWVYKHAGVVGYINLHGSLDSRIDIYHNWPGFFALGAWFSRIAGLSSPLAYASWAPVYFNLLVCLELGFVFRSLPVTARARWYGMFLFVAGNWVGQDYFSPQALAFLLSLGAFGMALAWLQVDRPPALVRVARRMASRLSRAPRHGDEADDGPLGRSHAGRVAALSALFVVFATVVVTHQLSPYMIVVGFGLLTAAGVVRPRWVVVGLLAMAIGYLLVRLPYVQRTQSLFSPLGDPFSKYFNRKPGTAVAMKGHQRSALAAPALMASVWALAMLGVARRLRTGRPILALILLAFSPILIALAQSYGGEAILRIYLFSLPWVALLAGSALERCSGRGRLWPVVTVGAVLPATVAMLLFAFYGSAELYAVRPGEVQAGQYFYDHAAPRSVLRTVAPNFPASVGDRYNEFGTAPDVLSMLSTAFGDLHNRSLDPSDPPVIAQLIERSAGPGASVGQYLVLSKGQQVYAEVMGLSPPGSLARLDRALAESPDWQVFYRNTDAVIYRLASSVAPGPAAGQPVEHAAQAVLSRQPRDRSVDLAGLGAGLFGVGAVGLALRRRHAGVPGMAMAGEDEAAVAEASPSLVATSAATAADLLRQAMLRPISDRHLFRLKIGDLEPEPGRLHELVSAVAAGHRAEAVRLLVDAWGPIPANDLRQLWHDPSAAVRAAAVSALGPTAEDVAVLRRRLSDDVSSDVRLTAIGVLARAPERDQLAALDLALDDAHPEIRAGALETLPVAGTSRAASRLVTATEDHQEAVRVAAYRRLAGAPSWVLWTALGRSSRRSELLGVVEEETGTDQLTALVLERIASPDVGDRVLALQLSGHLGTPALLAEAAAALADHEASVRRQAALALDADESTATAPLLAFLGALADPDPEVRGSATRALMRHPSAGLALRLAAELATSNVEVHGQLLLSMGSPGEAALVTAVADGPPERAAAAIGLLERTNVAATLLADLAAVDPKARMRAVTVLGALGTVDALQGLVIALGDARPVVRATAVRSLGLMGDMGQRHAIQRIADHDQAAEVVDAANHALRLIDERARTTGVPAR
ncbi:MAG: HEAT repeat domain-containing protein [Actinomycetota bacterium]|nr:HEAT repeat domain-containing protein [Actinomycetota bacterium]